MTKGWYPKLRLEQESSEAYGIIILNQLINKNALSTILEKASLLVCADAGAERLRSYGLNEDCVQRLPDAIIGDLDSVSKDTLGYYQKRGVAVVEDPDQYSTDFTKCLKWMRQKFDKEHGQQSELDILVMGGLGGRVDQGFSQIHHLYMVLDKPELLRGDIYLLSEQSMTFVLEQGVNEIHVGREVFAECCGVVPVAGKTTISMTGFEWDVKDWVTEFGGQMSTSQHLKSDLVKVQVDGPRPLFTLELAKKLQAEA